MITNFPFPKKAVLEIGKALYEMRGSLSAAERMLKGLLLKTESRTFMCYLQGDVLILLELDAAADVDGVYSALNSLVGSAVPAAVTPQVQLPQQAVVAEAAVATPAEVDGANIDWSEFHKSILSGFKTVAPAQLAKKLISEAMRQVGVASGTEMVTFDQASAVAFAASEKVPNEARRAMLKKELQALLEKYSA